MLQLFFLAQCLNIFSFRETDLLDVKREAIASQKPKENRENESELTKSKDTCKENDNSRNEKASVRDILFQDSESDSDDFYRYGSYFFLTYQFNFRKYKASSWKVNIFIKIKKSTKSKKISIRHG